MSLAGLLVLAAALLAAAGIREYAKARASRTQPASRQADEAALPGWMDSLPLLGREAATLRLERAGPALGGDLRGLVLMRLLAATGALMLLLPIALATQARPFLILVPAGAVLALALPDLILELVGARRRRLILTELPDVIDTLLVAVSGGRSVRAALSEIARRGQGALARELAVAVADIEAGVGVVPALEALRRRVPLTEIATLIRAIDRSARLGSPLAEELGRQALALRDDQRRQITERAARAAPKIQLVIALVLVPSVLMMLAAYLAANAGRFFGSFGF